MVKKAINKIKTDMAIKNTPACYGEETGENTIA
jgi:hypothetical protein